MENVIDILEDRGFIEAIAGEQLRAKAAAAPLKVYCGFDPTSDSLHLGNLVAIMGLAWFQRCGHTPVALIGGATAMIGDPSGKSSERQLLDGSTIAHNAVAIRKNLETILRWNSSSAPALFLNNADWLSGFSLIEFLRDVGKHFRLSTMLAKESVKARLAVEAGMSFTEFCYQILQGYDFLHLFESYGVAVQMGGSDQWGNITAGIELIRKVSAHAAYGITFPLLVRSDGQKFGKSEKGAIWLSKEKLSPFEFYQYLVRIPDADIIVLMRLLTFMDMEEIRTYERAMQGATYEPNSAQKRLAVEVTRLVHGEEGVATALRATEGLAPGSATELDATMLEALTQDIPTCSLPYSQVIGAGVLDLFVTSGLASSKGEARRLIQNGGAYLNNIKVEKESACVDIEQLIDGRFLLLAVGKKNKLLVSLQ